ncbi:MAG TPA: translocation/assembly module TamB domain-containing protein, partial [Candidatus Babeliaceae bacterium]|nr:translocation/assembly module TamB domain-containing protein [Candidatus Babeliaceae bacterium]
PYSGKIKISPIHIQSLMVGAPEDPLLDLTVKDGYRLHISHELIRALICFFTSIDIPGEGIISAVIKQEKDNFLNIELSLDEAAIKIPYTGDIIREFKGKLECNLKTWQITLSNAFLQFINGGKLSTSKAIFNISDQGSLDTLCLPIIVQNYLYHWQRTLFTLISGHIIFCNQDKPNLTNLKGYISLDRSHIHTDKIPSTEPKKENNSFLDWTLTLNPNILVDIHCSTQANLHIKSPFIDCTAQGNCAITGSLCHPEILGKISIAQGSLNFPYQPLYCTHGTVTFSSANLEDPIIELYAKNMIKKYSISLAITGSGKQPKLAFNADPHLEEDQIIALLLGGAEDGSLYLIMPQAVVKGIENFLTSTGTGSTIMNKLKNIRIASSLSDQEGQGGIRGSLAIEFNDKLRGLIEKRFNSQEEVRLEVAYDLSDTATIRGFKDEHGEVGAEIETQWKF